MSSAKRWAAIMMMILITVSYTPMYAFGLENEQENADVMEQTELADESLTETVDINDTIITLDQEEFIYDSQTIPQPVVSVEYEGAALVENEDYELLFDQSNTPGTHIVKVTGVGQYSGEAEITYEIIEEETTPEEDPEERPDVGVGDGADPKTVGTGEDTKDGDDPKDGDATETPAEKEFDINLSVGETITLETGYSTDDPEDVLVWETDNDEIISLGENGLVTGAAVGSCTVTAVSEATGAKFIFNISVTLNIENCTVTLPYSSKVYTGNAFTPTVTVTDESGNELTADDYTVTYLKNTNIGTATVKVNGINNYSGTVSKTFKILPGKGVIKKLDPDNKKITVSIKELPGGVKYQIQYKKSGNKTWKSLTNGTKLTRTVKGLKNRSKYIFRVRAFKVVSGKTYYGKWSATKSKLSGIPISKCTVKGIKNKTYNGKNQKQDIKVYYKGKRIKVKITYGNHKAIGSRYVKISGIGKFAGTVTKRYLIKPGKVKITGMHPFSWVGVDRIEDEYDYECDYVYDDEYSYDDDYIKGVDLKCSKTGGGVSYQFAFKWGGNSWKYCSYGSDRSVCWFDFPKNRKLYAKVRAYKKVNGKKIYGPWSAVQTESSYNKIIKPYSYYEKTSRYVQGKITGCYKGEIIQVKVGNRTYTRKVTKNGTNKFKIYVGRVRCGNDIIIKLKTKYKEDLYTYTLEAWYAKRVSNGMTKRQVKYTWGSPSDTSSASGGWTYWYYDDGSCVYFRYGRVRYWYDAAG